MLGSILLVAQPASLVQAQRIIPLSDTLLAATDELPVRFRTLSAGMYNYRFGEFFVLSRQGGTTTATQRDRGPILDRRAIGRHATSFRYAVKSRDSGRVSVSVRTSGRSEVERPTFAIGARFEEPDDTVEVANITTATIVFEDDTAGAWKLLMDERTGTRVPDRYSFEATITSGTRIIRLLPVRGTVPPSRGLFGFLSGGGAYGFVFEENGRAFAAVQYAGAGSRPMDLRVWMPTSFTARERLELAAIFTAVLVSARIPAAQRRGPSK